MDKLEILFTKLNLEDDLRKYFKEGKLVKVKTSRKGQKWTIYLELKEILPPDIYSLFVDRLENTFSDIQDIELAIMPVKNYDEKLLVDYWPVCLKKLKCVSQVMVVFSDRAINVQGKTINIEAYNLVEKDILNKCYNEILTLYKNYGFGKINLNVINVEKPFSIEEEKVEIPKEVKEKEVVTDILYGQSIKGAPTKISELTMEMNNIVVEGYLFGVDFFEPANENSRNIITLKITDYSDSIYAKLFIDKGTKFEHLKDKIYSGMWLKVKGNIRYDSYSKDYVLNVNDINLIDSETKKVKDNASKKRVELHVHTKMSQLDGVVDVKDLIKTAKEWGHKAVAITDHNCCQAFPDAYHFAKANDFKVIYGVELAMVNDAVKIVENETDCPLEGTTFVVFDLETTGFNAGGDDKIIEFGAVKLQDGKIIDRFEQLVDPKRPLADKIIEITNITDEMLKGMPSEEEVLKEFISWIGDAPLVAHNAPFDTSFLKSACTKYNLPELKNTVIDTLELSRNLNPTWGRHGLKYLVNRYNVTLENHHRAVHDAEATALVFSKMISELKDINITKINEIKNLVNKDEIHKTARNNHIILLAKNNEGLKNLYKLVSLANTKYYHKGAKILRSEIEKYREGLLIGSACSNGEIFEMARHNSDEEIINAMKFYDYIEVQPLEVYDALVQKAEFNDIKEVESLIERIITLGRESGKLVCATGDVHHLRPEDKIYREVFINTPSPGGGRHPLDNAQITNIPSQHFRTTDEMLNDFSFLDEETKEEIVITNPNKVADMIEEIQIIKDKLYTPVMENSDKIITDMVYEKAHEIYGNPLPKIIEERIKKELESIIGNKFDVIYYISHKLVKKSLDDGYLVGSRGSVGSSLVATLLEITEVNPLPPHYVCPNCKHSIFEEDGKQLGSVYGCGFDLPKKLCPECKTEMHRDGHDIPFETFLGFKGDKVPDIDLNFSGTYQPIAHNYVKELFGETKAFRAGTIGTVADKTSYGFVMGFAEDKNKTFRPAEIERLVLGCTGVKRTTGQHPGGIIVVPKDLDIYDFTPIQYPADDTTSSWYTTHFDYHAIEESLLKLDILGHDDPTTIKMLEDLSGINPKNIPLSDEKVLSLFSSAEALGLKPLKLNVVADKIQKKDTLFTTGTLGVPEYGTDFVIQMLEETTPKTVAELVKISGLSHGTDVWLNNAQTLIQEKICEFNETIGCRDDIMVYLMYQGLEPETAFEIMEFVRKGKPSREKEKWQKYVEIMKKNGIPKWYIESCGKIKYMFPKAHATAYVIMALRIAYFKVYHPIMFYASYFSVRAMDFDIDAMIQGYDAIKRRIEEIVNKGYEATPKEKALITVLEVALEMTARGFKFGNVDLYKSDAHNFIISEDGKTLIPPFRTIDGLGVTVAEQIVKERNKGPFLSKEDLQKRGKISSTLLDKMNLMGITKDLPETNQLVLF
jgi:DNA polymerase-3 subunit alpha (Gram-positive type)